MPHLLTHLHTKKNDTDMSKPVARHFNIPNHSHHNMTICGLSTTPREHRAAKISNKNSSFNWVRSKHTGSMKVSHSTNLFSSSCHLISTRHSSSTLPYELARPHNSSIRSDEGLTLETAAF